MDPDEIVQLCIRDFLQTQVFERALIMSVISSSLMN